MWGSRFFTLHENKPARPWNYAGEDVTIYREGFGMIIPSPAFYALAAGLPVQS